nr:serine carboxypeptidase-like 11 isoform X1 [Ipomoea batatas]
MAVANLLRRRCCASLPLLLGTVVLVLGFCSSHVSLALAAAGSKVEYLPGFRHEGPLLFDLPKNNSALPTLSLNPYSWTKVASFIFLDLPVGTGFSYVKSSKNYTSNSEETSDHGAEFLRKWLADHPEYQSNSFYVGGDSFSGVIVPMVVNAISYGINLGLNPQIDLKGYFVGNAFTYPISYIVQMIRGFGLIPDEMYKGSIEEWVQCRDDLPFNRTVLDSRPYYAILSMQGTIPNELGNLHNLKTFAIEGNQIIGSIPMFISNMSSLQILSLSTNKLMGSIPKEIGNLSSLQGLMLAENNFTGVIPREISYLSKLELVVFEVNNLSGTIPEGLFNLTKLRGLSLANNHLLGSIPSTMCSAQTNLEILILAQNVLSRVIPYSIANCSQLSLIALNDNHFSGSIPNSLENLSLLQSVGSIFDSVPLTA